MSEPSIMDLRRALDAVPGCTSSEPDFVAIQAALDELEQLRDELKLKRRLFSEAVAERDTLRKALESIQWGSCDGCGNMSHCPECRAYRLNHDPEGWATLPGVHKPECSIGLALARR